MTTWTHSPLAAPDYVPQFGVYSDTSPNAIAVVRGENAADHAALFAAAPAMLEALEAIAQWALQNYEPSLGRIAENAIAAAKGGQQ